MSTQNEEDIKNRGITTTRTADITSTQCEEDIQYEEIKPTSIADIEISTHTREDRKEEKKGE